MEVDFAIKALLTAIAGGLVTLNGKLVYDGIKSYKYRKNGTDRRQHKTEKECNKDMNKQTEKFSNKISEVHARIDDSVNKIGEVGEGVSFIRGKIEGVLDQIKK
ncbi:MAG TPA: hypothetical protein ENH30_01505 [Nitrospirae bacterium]|nr:hypothetical protein [Nitrospirota bacterium]